MIVLKSVLSLLLLIRYVFAAPSIIGADKSLVRLPDQSATIKQELGRPINERNEDEFQFSKIEKRFIRYHVPGTETTIIVRLRDGLDRAALFHILRDTRTAVLSVIHSHGDGVLPPNSDPYLIYAYGLIFNVFSDIRQTKRLTYKILLDVMRALLKVLIDESNDCGAGFEIFERGGRIGGGSIRQLRGS